MLTFKVYMTYERKITVGLEDIKAIIFECKKCKSRFSMSPDSGGEPPYKCLRSECSTQWRPPDLSPIHSGQSPFFNFVDGLAMIRKWMLSNDSNLQFTIILEFDETEMMKTVRP